MGFDPGFLDFMTTTATYEPFASDDGWGDRTFGSTIAVPCHVTYKRKIIRTDTEEDAVSTAQIQIPPPGWVIGAQKTPALAVDDHILLPDGQDRRILNIMTYTDENGPHHQSADLT